LEHCRKRAVRSNVGVQPGEFRYFETHRLGGPDNLGHGVIGADAQIDPYCCFDSSVAPGVPYTGTPTSLAFNSVGGVFKNLVYHGGNFGPGPFDQNLTIGATSYYGFAVDYTASHPVIYVVLRNGDNSMTVSDGIELTDFGPGPVMPMLYGHPVSNAEPASSINLGLQKFHYDLAALKAELALRGAPTASFEPGVGIHRWAP
jgi:hypothetical protein